jgi:four helix bundle protein
MGKGGFKELKVWQKSKELAVTIYRVTGENSLAKDFGLKDQMRRAAVSISSNIAEGDERNAGRDSIRFFNIAKGSLAELVTQIEIAHEVGYLSAPDMNSLEEECQQIGKMLGALIKARKNSHEAAITPNL